jgi:hypothetical protein
VHLPSPGGLVGQVGQFEDVFVVQAADVVGQPEDGGYVGVRVGVQAHGGAGFSRERRADAFEGGEQVGVEQLGEDRGLAGGDPSGDARSAATHPRTRASPWPLGDVP